MENFYRLVPHGTAILLLLCLNAPAQDLSSLGKKDPIKVSGSLGSSQTLYIVSGIPFRRPPYLWFLNGNVNIDIYGWNIPLSAFWSNQNKEFRQPFNQYGISPRYKWITVHAGYRNLSFSPYTLSGHTFFGAGAELNPGIWRFAAMYGRLNKAIAEDTLSGINIVPAYRRMGYGFKAGIAKEGDFIELIFFSAKDDPSSLPYVPLQQDVLPAENMVVSLNLQKKAGKKTVFSMEYAGSAYTRDTRAPLQEGEIKNVFSPLYTHRGSTQYYNAFKSSLRYTGNFYSLSFNYERIEPEYRTLGSYFFNNDLENITIAPSLRMFKQKFNLNANTGLQRNNIHNSNTSSMHRILGSVNCSYIPNQRWNFTGQYSNFVTYMRLSPRFDQFRTLDTLNFYQVTESGGLNSAYQSGGKNIRHGLSLNLSWRTANQTRGEQVTSDQSIMYNGNMMYRMSLLPGDISFSAGLTANRNTMAEISSLAIGPAVAVNKSFLDKKLRTGLSASYNQISINSKSTGNGFNTAFNAGYTYLNKNTFVLNVVMLGKNTAEKNGGFRELTGTFGYNYSF